MVGGGLAVRRSALVHHLQRNRRGARDPLRHRSRQRPTGWVLDLYDPDWGVLAMACTSAACSSSRVSLPSIRGSITSRDFIVRISGTGSESAVSRLDPTLVEAGGEVALEAAWRATLEVGHGAVDAIRRRLAGESVTYDPPDEAVQQIEHFLASLPLETTDLGKDRPPTRPARPRAGS